MQKFFIFYQELQSKTQRQLIDLQSKDIGIVVNYNFQNVFKNQSCNITFVTSI